MKKLYIMLLLLVSLSIFCSCTYQADFVNEEYYEGYEEGYSEGYDDGIEYGNEEGRSVGYGEGYEDGYQSVVDSAKFDDMYESGYDSGYESGYSACKEENYEDWYYEGYYDAEHDYLNGFHAWLTGRTYFIEYDLESEHQYLAPLTCHKYSYDCMQRLSESEFQAFFAFYDTQEIDEWNAIDPEWQIKPCPICIGE